MLIFRVKKIAENARGTAFTFNKGRERAERKKNKREGGETAVFYFGSYRSNQRRRRSPTAPAPAKLRRGRSGAGRRSVLPFSHSKQGRAAGLLFPRGLRAPFPAPATLSEEVGLRSRRQHPRESPSTAHSGRSRILHDTQTLCRKRQY